MPTSVSHLQPPRNGGPGESTDGSRAALRTVDVFSLGQGNPCGCKSLAVVRRPAQGAAPAEQDEPPPIFAAGCHSVWLYHQVHQTASQAPWSPVATSRGGASPAGEGDAPQSQLAAYELRDVTACLEQSSPAGHHIIAIAAMDMTEPPHPQRGRDDAREPVYWLFVALIAKGAPPPEAAPPGHLGAEAAAAEPADDLGRAQPRPGLWVFEVTQHDGPEWRTTPLKQDFAESLGGAFPVAMWCFPHGEGATQPFASDRTPDGAAGLLVSSSAGRVHAFRIVPAAARAQSGRSWQPHHHFSPSLSPWLSTPQSFAPYAFGFAHPQQHYHHQHGSPQSRPQLDMLEEKDVAQLRCLRSLAEVRGVVLCIDRWVEPAGRGQPAEQELWAAGCQQGSVLLWRHSTEPAYSAGARRQSPPPQPVSTVLLNGPVSAVCFFRVSSGAQRERRERASHALRKQGLLRAADCLARCPEPAGGICDRPALAVAEAQGRVVVFWDVLRQGLSHPDALEEPGQQDPPANSPAGEGRQAGARMSVDSAAQGYPRFGSDQSTVREGTAATAGAQSAAVACPSPPTSCAAGPWAPLTPLESQAFAGGSFSSPAPPAPHPLLGRRSAPSEGVNSPGAVAASATRAAASLRPAPRAPRPDGDPTPQQGPPPQPQPAPGPPPRVSAGRLSAGVLSLCACDITEDGQAELLVGTFAQDLVVYGIAPCPGRNPPFRYVPRRVRPFCGAVRCIAPADVAPDTPGLWVLTTHHLHALAHRPQAQEQRLRERSDLLQQLEQLEAVQAASERKLREVRDTLEPGTRAALAAQEGDARGGLQRRAEEDAGAAAVRALRGAAERAACSAAVAAAALPHAAPDRSPTSTGSSSRSGSTPESDPPPARGAAAPAQGEHGGGGDVQPATDT